MKRICAIFTAVAALGLILTGTVAADNPVWELIAFDYNKVVDVAVDPVTTDNVFVAVANETDSLKAFDGVFKSIDAGGTWNRVLDTTPDGYDVSLSCLAISENHPQVMWAGSLGNKAYRSTDYGETWTEISIGSGFMNEIYYIRISDVTPYSLFVSGREGLFKSTDGGGEFTQLDLDGQLLGTYGLAMMNGDHDKLYTGAKGDDVYKSEDGGDTWVSVNAGLPEGFYSKAIVIDSEDFDLVYTYMTKAQTKPQLWKSTDGGSAWIDMGEDENLGNMISLHAGNLIFGSIVGNGLFYSTTSGTGFATFANGLDDANLLSIANVGDNAWNFFGASDKGLWYTEIASLPPGQPSTPEVVNTEPEREIYVSWNALTENGDGSELDGLMGYVIYRALNQFLDENFEVIDTLIYNGDTPMYTDYAFMTALYAYKVAGIDSSGVIGDPCSPYGGPVGVGIESGTPAIHVTSLGQNSPNPFNPHTTITFSIGGFEPARANLSIYDLTGKLVVTLVDGIVEPGDHSVVWDGNDTAGRSSASGVYLYTLEARETRETRKMVLVK